MKTGYLREKPPHDLSGLIPPPEYFLRGRDHGSGRRRRRIERIVPERFVPDYFQSVRRSDGSDEDIASGHFGDGLPGHGFGSPGKENIDFNPVMGMGLYLVSRLHLYVVYAALGNKIGFTVPGSGKKGRIARHGLGKISEFLNRHGITPPNEVSRRDAEKKREKKNSTVKSSEP
jgi:hypothetical protein